MTFDIDPANKMPVMAEALDSIALPEVIGSIAGDNTIFLAAKDHKAAEIAVERIHGLIK